MKVSSTVCCAWSRMSVTHWLWDLVWCRSSGHSSCIASGHLNPASSTCSHLCTAAGQRYAPSSRIMLALLRLLQGAVEFARANCLARVSFRVLMNLQTAACAAGQGSWLMLHNASPIGMHGGSRHGMHGHFPRSLNVNLQGNVI